MRALLPAALAALALAVPAHADPPDDAVARGTCSLVAANETTGAVNQPDRWDGVMAAAVAAWSPTLAHNVVLVSVLCEVRDDNGAVTHVTFAGQGFAGGAQPVTFYASRTSDLRLCTTIHTLDWHGHARTTVSCDRQPVTVEMGQPEEVRPFAQALCDSVNDYTLCTLLNATRVRIIARV